MCYLLRSPQTPSVLADLVLQNRSARTGASPGTSYFQSWTERLAGFLVLFSLIRPS